MCCIGKAETHRVDAGADACTAAGGGIGIGLRASAEPKEVSASTFQSSLRGPVSGASAGWTGDPGLFTPFGWGDVGVEGPSARRASAFHPETSASDPAEMGVIIVLIWFSLFVARLQEGQPPPRTREPETGSPRPRADDTVFD